MEMETHSSCWPGGVGFIPASKPTLGYISPKKHSSSLQPQCWSFGRVGAFRRMAVWWQVEVKSGSHPSYFGSQEGKRWVATRQTDRHTHTTLSAQSSCVTQP